MEIEGEIDASHADENKRLEFQRAFFQFMGHHGGDVLPRRAVGVQETDDIGDWKIEFHGE